MGRKISALLLIICMLSFCFSACSENTGRLACSIAKTESKEQSADFELHMLDVHQGLSLLIKSDGKYLLYDGGGRTTSSYVVSYLKQQGVEKLDYMVASHYDDDHISGLIGVLNTIELENAITPDYQADTETYASFRRKLEASKAKELHPKQGDNFKLGTSEIEIIGPSSYDNFDENDNSIAMRIKCGQFSVVLTGDAGAEAESEMLRRNSDLSSELYVVAHHGSDSSSSEEFLKAIKPCYAFISVGEENDYGHPSDALIKRLKDIKCEIYRTDKQGEVTVFYDGQSVSFSTDPYDDSSDNADNTTAQNENSSEKCSYVLNNNTMKFHYPSCRSVREMNEWNKEETTANREALIEQGYSPCGNCRP